MSSGLIPFGKHKGKPVEFLAEDPQYCNWLTAQPWFREKYGNFYTLIVNNFTECNDTPEHNRLQAKFMDDIFCLKLWKLLKPEDSVFFDHSKTLDFLCKKISATASAPLNVSDIQICSRGPVFDRRFEERGVDVLLNGRWEMGVYGPKKFCPWNDCEFSSHLVAQFELKPVVGDDYPTILRQMKRLHVRHLIVGDYMGEGVKSDMFVKIFWNERIVVLFERDIENVKLPDSSVSHSEAIRRLTAEIERLIAKHGDLDDL